MHSGPPLVNGRGPLDGFLSRRRPAPSDENVVIDLTADNISSPVKRLVSPAPASPCLPTKDKHQGKDKTASSGKPCSVDHTPETHTLDCTVVDTDEEEDVEEEEDEDQTASISQLDTTQDSESEPEEHDESGNVSSLGNRSMLSASSVSSTSESSPEKSRTDDPTPTTTPTVCTSAMACFLFTPTKGSLVLSDAISHNINLSVFLRVCLVIYLRTSYKNNKLFITKSNIKGNTKCDRRRFSNNKLIVV